MNHSIADGAVIVALNRRHKLYTAVGVLMIATMTAAPLWAAWYVLDNREFVLGDLVADLPGFARWALAGFTGLSVGGFAAAMLASALFMPLLRRLEYLVREEGRMIAIYAPNGIRAAEKARIYDRAWRRFGPVVERADFARGMGASFVYCPAYDTTNPPKRY